MVCKTGTPVTSGYRNGHIKFTGVREMIQKSSGIMHGHTTGPFFFFAENTITTGIYVNMLEFNNE
jgi:hypothetical protein